MEDDWGLLQAVPQFLPLLSSSQALQVKLGPAAPACQAFAIRGRVFA